MAGRHVGRIIPATTRSPMIQIIDAENMELKKISRGSAHPSQSASTGNGAAGVSGQATGGSGFTEGVMGESASTSGEGVFGLFRRELAPWFNLDAKGTYRAGQKYVGAGLLARDPSAGAIDIRDLVIKAVLLELETVCPERIGFDDVRAAPNIIAVDLLNDTWIGQVEFIETGVQVNALAVEHGPHAAVAKESPLRKRFQE
jgi:hypothetical protein